MNKFTLKDYTRWSQLTYRRKPLTATEQLELIGLNHQMIKAFPFLMPRNADTGKTIYDFNYTWNQWSHLAELWGRAFGWEFLTALAETIKEDNIYIRPEQDFGSMRVRVYNANKETLKVISFYEEKSRRVLDEYLRKD